MNNNIGSEQLSISKNRLTQALSAPISAKLSITPEIRLQETSDPTSLLLLSTYLNKMSESLRKKAKANAVIWASSSLDSLQLFSSEQQTARGKIPGPLPIIYSCNREESYNLELLNKIYKAGASGVLVPLMNGSELCKAADLLASEDSSSSSIYESALSCGLHAIPEIILSPTSSWSDEEVESLVDAVKTKCGFPDPAAIVFTFGTPGTYIETTEEDTTSLPIVQLPKALIGGTVILGSIRTPAGDGRLGNTVSLLKSAGFSGAVLRSESVPETTLLGLDLEKITQFWCAAISQLKSVKSKTFGGFRAKNQMDAGKSAPEQWASYTSKLLDEGVLPTSSPADSGNLNTDRGDYKGF